MNLTSKVLSFQPWNQNVKGGLKLLSSPLFDEQENLVHAFTTRLGGKTPEPYESFNIGRHVKDDQIKNDAVVNRKTLCAELGADYEKIAIPAQVHSAEVRIVEHGDSRPEMKGVDGLLTSSKNLPLLLSFADCVPVMVFDRVKQVIGIFHAGWRGTANKIVKVGCELMISHYGSHSSDLIAAVGPAIGRCCYPTGDDVCEQLRVTVDYPDELFDELNGQKCPDLKAINAMQLYESGVSEVDVSDWCTACNPEIFYSHRQSGGVTGRQGAVISLK